MVFIVSSTSRSLYDGSFVQNALFWAPHFCSCTVRDCVVQVRVGWLFRFHLETKCAHISAWTMKVSSSRMTSHELCVARKSYIVVCN